MSATRDKNQKITFVYSNLYAIYRKGIERARDGAIRESGESSPSRAAEALLDLASTSPTNPAPAQGFESGVVIKARTSSRAQSDEAPRVIPAGPRVTPYTPAELIGKRVARPERLAAAEQKAPPEAVASLKDNLKSLNDLQARLRFMLKELEELIKE
jgi:hypothetical protein